MGRLLWGAARRFLRKLESHVTQHFHFRGAPPPKNRKQGLEQGARHAPPVRASLTLNG